MAPLGGLVLLLLLLVLVVDASAGKPAAEHVLTFDSFEDYKRHHNKTYLRTFNEDRGRKAFADNLLLIEEHNADNHTFMLRPNNLADLVRRIAHVRRVWCV